MPGVVEPGRSQPAADLCLPRPDAIAVVIVNWNSWRLSLDCLRSLERSVGATWHAFLVDNASTDDSLRHLVDLGGNVTFIRAPTNGGWTGGNNLGVERALARGFDRFFILNNDAQVRPDTLANLLRVSDAQPVPPVLGPVNLSGDGSYVDFLGAVVDPRTGMPVNVDADTVDFAAYPREYATSYVRGAGLFVTRAHFERLGLFDDDYYLNYDETDWCFRARAAGFPVMMTKAAEILHVGSASIGGGTSPINVYFLTRNALLFAERHGTRAQRARQAADLVRRLLWRQPVHGRLRRLASYLRDDGAVARASRAGLRDYLLRRFGNCPPEIRALGRAG